MNDFTSIYLGGLRAGIAKKASVMNFQPFKPENARVTGGAAGAAIGGVAGGLGNALMGSSEIDPRTGKKRNGVLARLLKGGLVGAAGGAAAGALAGPAASDLAGQMASQEKGPFATGAMQSATLADLLTKATGSDLPVERQIGLGVDGLIQGGKNIAKGIFPQ